VQVCLVLISADRCRGWSEDSWAVLR